MSNEAEISQILANAKKQLEQKKAAMGLNTQPAVEKRDEIAALKAKIAATMATAHVQNIITNTTKASIQEQAAQRQLNAQERERSLNLIIDSEGRTVDKRTGELVQLQSRVPTLKANLKVQKRDLKSNMMLNSDKKTDLFASGFASTISGGLASTLSAVNQGLASSIGAEGISSSSWASTATATAAAAAAAATSTTAQQNEKFFDPRLKLKGALRNKRKLAFIEKGKFEEIANKLRTKAKLTLLQQEIASISKKTGISSESKLALIQPKKVMKENIPNIEWWDFAVLNEINYDCLDKLTDAQLREKLKITKLIEHPVQMKPPTHTEKKVITTVMLTAKERKKLRRQNRSEALKEEQEKIRLGLMPPPEPKVKISNLMRVLGTEAVQDPTKVEEYVRNQMAKRQKAHEEHNASRKLTDTERAAKKKRKIMENTATGVQVSVYRVRDLNDPAVKFKLEANCNQLHMTGIVLLYKNLNVIVVEGGPKQQRKFRRLMLNRIKWSEITNKKAEVNNDGEREKNSCRLVWEGTIKTRLFGNIIFKMCPTITFAQEYLKKLGCEHYWDIAQSDAVLQSSDF